jgi:type IV secretory pathway VirB4 component
VESGKDQERYRLDLGILQDLNQDLPIINKVKSRFSHTYVLGKTGMGKSVLMERMAHYDISQDISIVYIDPKGDSSKRLHHLNQDKNIRYVSINNPIVINPLKKQGYIIDDIITEFVQVLDILVTLTSPNPESTVLMREIIGKALRAFKDDQKALDYLVDFLLYEKTRKNHKMPANVAGYWEEFDALDRNIRRNKDKIESAKRVASRLMEICDGRMRDFVIGENELYIDRLLENNQSLLVDTSRMSRTSRIYISNLIVYSIVSYCEFEIKNRKPLIVYVDEFQECASPYFSEMLAKSRDKQVGWVLAHHDFEEISPKVLSSVFGNVNAFIVFRIGDKEADRMAGLFDLKKKDFLDLDEYMAWVRLGNKNINIQTYPPLTKEAPDILPHPSKQEVKFLRDAWVCYNENI